MGGRRSKRVIDTPLTRVIEDGELLSIGIQRAIDMGLIKESDLDEASRVILNGGSCRIRFTDIRRRSDGKPFLAAGNVLAFNSSRKRRKKR